MKHLRKRISAGLLCLALLAACSANTWLVSGELVNEVGQQFLATGKMYDDLFRAGVVTAEEYRAWAVFAVRFKTVYPSVAQAWQTAQSAEQAGDAADAVIALKNELLQFYLTAAAKGGN